MIHLLTRPHLSSPLFADLLKEAARETLRQHSALANDLTLVLTDNEEIQELNRIFRHHDAPTDVLAFPSGERDPDTHRRYLGDVVISLPQAMQQADEHGCPLENEVCLLVVHGILHLLGYDHADEEERQRMWSAQTQILGRLGINDSA